MPSLTDIFERQHLRNITRTAANIRLHFDETVVELSYTAQYITYRGGVFRLDAYPFLKAKLEELLPLLHDRITIELVNGIQRSWDISNAKNDAIVDRRLGDRQPVPERAQVLYDPNLEARNAFIRRKQNGLNLSQRVWKTMEPFKTELERGLAVGISEGQSAQEMARNLQQYLVEPEKLFRKVRNEKGQAVLSKAAREYKPGVGVYRSSFKNALRLTRTEVQLSYQNADFLRWQSLPFIKGVDVRLSNRHPKYDVCDVCAGLHPPDYKFILRHPNCLCHCVPVLVSGAEYDAMEDYILGLTDKKPDFPKITTIPDSEAAWMRNNAERVKGWKRTPLFITENKKYLKPLLK